MQFLCGCVPFSGGRKQGRWIEVRLLVVEDEKDLNGIIVKALQGAEYNVEACYDGDTALDYLMSEEYDGAILDIMLPGVNGFDILKKIRMAGVQTPVIFLTAKDDVEDIVRGLDTGADDYIIKPFVLKELLARVRVMIRRKSEVQENVYYCMDLKVDYNKHEVERAGTPISLSPKEFAILLYLIRNKNIVVTRDQIEANVWSLDAGSGSNVVDVYIRYLRRKIDDRFDYKMIQTIRGTGYMLKCEE